MPLRLLFALAVLGLLGGCYVLDSARGQLELNARRVPITRLLQAPDTPTPLRAHLALASRIRDYASRELALPDNASYRSYADLGRPFVVWNVFATAAFSIEPRSWCFPVVGCVAYRGYFSERRARDYALGLEAHGDDTLVSGVAAYSTLGHFADPLLNTMLRWDETELASLVFHELAHQRLYFKGDSAFNEAFATVVEREGVRRWLEAAARPAELAEYRARQTAAREVAALVSDSRTRLQALYGSELPAAAMRAAKAAEFDRLRRRYAARRDALRGYDWLFGAGLNNARLLAVATYQDCVPGLEARLAELDNDLPRFYAQARTLARMSRPARRAALCGAAVADD